jgi:hypothetical protein
MLQTAAVNIVVRRFILVLSIILVLSQRPWVFGLLVFSEIANGQFAREEATPC